MVVKPATSGAAPTHTSAPHGSSSNSHNPIDTFSKSSSNGTMTNILTDHLKSAANDQGGQQPQDPSGPAGAMHHAAHHATTHGSRTGKRA